MNNSYQASVRPFDELAALAALMCPHQTDLWTELPLDYSDAAALSRKPKVCLARSVPTIGSCTGYILVGPLFHELQVNAVLLDTRLPSEIITHRLVSARSPRRLVRFETCNQAANAFEPVAVTGGRLPPDWEWNPSVNLPCDNWRPRRLESWQLLLGVEVYELPGRSARWLVETSPFGGFRAKRNGREVRNAAGPVRHFAQLWEAQIFCEQQDLSDGGNPIAASRGKLRRQL